MQTENRWRTLGCVILVWAGLMLLRDVYEPEFLREPAIAQMQPRDDAALQLRAFEAVKLFLDWSWVAIPIAAGVLFRRELFGRARTEP